MTTQQIRNTKKQLREQYKKERLQLQREKRSFMDNHIVENIIQSQSFKYADTLLMFFPKEDEINILPLFEMAKKCGKSVAFPKCISPSVMEFFYVDDMSLMQEGKYGLLEPDITRCKKFEKSIHPLCIVPCLACTKEGYRLGYGGGYYDRFLASFEGISGCVQYEDFVVSQLPVEKRYDKKTDLIITQRKVYVIG